MYQPIDQQHPGKPSFFAAAALCAFFSAITTSILIFIEVPRSSDIIEQATLASNATYLFRTWTYFLHPFFAVISMIGVFMIQYRKNPGMAITALMFFIFWAFAEALQQAFALDALNQYWRPMLLNTNDAETAESAKHLLIGFNGIYDSFYFLLLFAFGCGSLLMGLLMVKGTGLERLLGIIMVYYGCLSLTSFISYYTPWQAASGFVTWNYQWIYTFLQPLARALLAWFLLRHSLLLNSKASTKQ